MKWICRTWTQTVHGWTSEMDRFETKEEAEEYGRLMDSLIREDDLKRDFEVYEA